MSFSAASSAASSAVMSSQARRRGTRGRADKPRELWQLREYHERRLPYIAPRQVATVIGAAVVVMSVAAAVVSKFLKK